MNNYLLFLDTPASEWELASPIGNGYSGAMIYGTAAVERIQLSDKFIWSGEPFDASYPPFRDRIEEIRKLLLDGKATEADEYASENLKDAFFRIKSQETAGELYIKLHSDDICENYRREICLNSGMLNISYDRGEHHYVREAFASYPDRIIAVRHSGKHDAEIYYERENILSTECIGNTMTVKAKTTFGNHEFTVKIKIVTDGKLDIQGQRFIVKNASETIYYIVLSAEKEPAFPDKLDYNELRTRHINDFSNIMNRSNITLSESPDSQLEKMPIDQRIERLKSDNTLTDAGLVEIYFQFGKYLLVGSSRIGTLPANLQGVWNGYMEAPWNNDYHTNINIQMNYWHSESANISECTMPLFDYMNNYLLQSGRKTAEINYKCRGTVVHHLSDIYGFTAPADGLWGLWPMGGAWLAYHMWEHYLYTQDKTFLRDTAYEYIRDSARFFLDYMFEDENGMMVTGPSASPENRYFCNGKPAFLCLSPTMDIEIISGLLRFYIETENILDINPEWKTEAEKVLAKMPPLKIGKYGQLMEWAQDYDEPEPGHRHISHMFALYPDCSINEDTPDLMTAARRTLERRLTNGGGHTGWSCAWLISLFARLGDAEGVMSNLTKLLTHSTRGNLLDSHPPFQIDGNFGAAAAIIEMVMQSHNGKIKLLPSLPTAFGNGHFERLMARGGVEVTAEWKNGIVCHAIFTAVRGDYNFVCSVNNTEYNVHLKKGESFEI